MATTTVLSNPALLIDSVDYSDQCTSAVLTITKEQLEATSFADSARSYTAGLTNVEVTCTLMLAYGTSEVEENLEANVLGQNVDVVIYGTNSTTASATNPEYTITGAYLAAMTPVNGALGELQQIDLTFTGGSYTRSVTP
jgi:hypothetical protein